MRAGAADSAGIRWMLASGFRMACTTGDARLLAAVVAANITIVVDGAGTVDVPRQPITGAHDAIAFLLHQFGPRSDTVATVQSVNGQGAVVFRDGQNVIAIACFAVVAQRIRTVWLVMNPAALRHWNRTPAARS